MEGAQDLPPAALGLPLRGGCAGPAPRPCVPGAVQSRAPPGALRSSQGEDMGGGGLGERETALSLAGKP